jgi:hypothetical protein
MALYSKKQYEHDLEAVDAASSCISAAIAGSDYAGRLVPYMDDYVRLTEYFWAKCPITRKKLEAPGKDVKEVATIFLALSRGTQVGGFQAKLFEATLERVRRKLKGKLLGARLILMDGDAKPKCNDPEGHKQPCKCKALTLARLAQAQVDMPLMGE